MTPFRGSGLPATEAGLSVACQKIGVEPEALWAVIFTETDGANHSGFWSDRRPQILFEQHVFHRLTNGAFDDSNPEISSAHAGNYGGPGDHQYERLNEAARCHREAAIQSTSWGIGQTLGENFSEAGFSSVETFLAAMLDSEDAQLDAMAWEIGATGCATQLRDHRWADFAKIYNGPNYRANQYDEKLELNYRNLSAAAPDLTVRTVQLLLYFLGFDPQGIDGVFGDHTRDAMRRFQTQAGLPTTSNINDATRSALVAAVTGLPN